MTRPYYVACRTHGEFKNFRRRFHKLRFERMHNPRILRAGAPVILLSLPERWVEDNWESRAFDFIGEQAILQRYQQLEESGEI